MQVPQKNLNLLKIFHFFIPVFICHVKALFGSKPQSEAVSNPTIPTKHFYSSPIFWGFCLRKWTVLLACGSGSHKKLCIEIKTKTKKTPKLQNSAVLNLLHIQTSRKLSSYCYTGLCLPGTSDHTATFLTALAFKLRY